MPSYALIVREYFPAREAGARVSLVLMASVVGMALGGWMSGEIFDLTGSYQAAFLNGIGWNLLNMAIASGCSSAACGRGRAWPDSSRCGKNATSDDDLGSLPTELRGWQGGRARVRPRVRNFGYLSMSPRQSPRRGFSFGHERCAVARFS